MSTNSRSGPEKSIKHELLRIYAYVNQGESMFSIPTKMFKMLGYASAVVLAWGINPKWSLVVAASVLPLYFIAGIFSRDHMIQSQIQRIERTEFDDYSKELMEKMDRVVAWTEKNLKAN